MLVSCQSTVRSPPPDLFAWYASAFESFTSTNVKRSHALARSPICSTTSKPVVGAAWAGCLHGCFSSHLAWTPVESSMSCKACSRKARRLLACAPGPGPRDAKADRVPGERISSVCCEGSIKSGRPPWEARPARRAPAATNQQTQLDANDASHEPQIKTYWVLPDCTAGG